MPHFNKSIPVRFLAKIATDLGSYGIFVGELLQEFGYPADILANESNVISLDHLDKVLEVIETQTDRDDWGILVGRRIHLPDYLPYEPNMIERETLGQLLHTCSILSASTHPSCILTYTSLDDKIVTRYYPVVDMSKRVMEFLFDTHAACCHEFVTYWLGKRAEPYQIYISKDDLDCYSDSFFEPAVVLRNRYSTPCVSIHISNHLLVMRRAHDLESSNQPAFSPPALGTGTLTQWTSLIVSESRHVNLTIDMCAEMQRVSVKTFSRRLKSEGSNFREIVKAAKHAKACRLLADSDLPVKQISNLLGYSSLSNFSSAFRKIQGLSPDAYRKYVS